jgi:antitoxin YefM
LVRDVTFAPCARPAWDAIDDLHLALGWTPRQLLVILMTMSEVSTLAETKAHLSKLVARVGAQHERVTVHGRPVAVLLAVDDLESLEETIAVLSDAAALQALNEADAELARGEGENQDSLAAAMQARRART